MHTVRNLILTLGVLFFFQLLFSQPKADSLIQEIEKSKGERKLELMFKLANHHIDTDEMFEIAKRIEKEALKQNNMRYLAGSYALKGRFFGTVENNIDSTIYYSELATQTYEEHDVNNPGDSFYLLAGAYLHQGYYELAIYNIKKYMNSKSNASAPYVSYNLLAEAYMATGRYSLAKEAVLQSMYYSELEETSTSPRNKLIDYLFLARIDMASGAYEDAIETCSMMEEILKQEGRQLHDHPSTILTYEIYYLYVDIYIKMGDTEKAKIYLNKAQVIAENSDYNLLKNNIKIIYGKYYLLTKDYLKALSYFDSALDYFEAEGRHQNISREIVNLKIKVLQALKRSDEALVLQQELTHYKDSIYRINVPLQVSQLSKNYELERISLERDKDKANLEKSKAINIGFIVVFGLFVVILVIVRHNTKKIKDKNKALYKRYKEVDKFLNSTVSKSNESESLFDRIEASMKEQQVYRQPNLTREDLAKILNTNRGYLTDAIKAETGKTFLEYVNQYRLNYARFQLMKDKSIPVIEIMYDCGFSSKSPFYRLFKEEFGMSPNEFREAKANLEEDI